MQVQKNMKQFVIHSLALIYCEYACVAIQAYISGDMYFPFKNIWRIGETAENLFFFIHW